MKFIVLACFALFGLSTSLNGQSEEADPYSINAVRFELQMRSGEKEITRHSWGAKRMAQLGDGISIALLKILDVRDLNNPKRVRDILPIIRDSFNDTQLISTESDKKPNVTLFLLGYLLQNVSDAQTQQDIRKTIEFVKMKTIEAGATNKKANS